MTISTTAASQIFLGNGVTASFDFSFIADSADFIEIIYTDTTGTAVTLSPTQYTLVINAPAAGQIWGVGGTVTYPTIGSPIANGTSLTISRVLPLTQVITISNQGDFAPQVIEEAIDTLCMEVQQISARTGQFRGTWVTVTSYTFGDIVTDGANGGDTGNLYMCTTANISSIWATDLAAGDWILVINSPVGAPLPLAVGSGGTHADLSLTGGTSQVLKQTTVGGNVSVGQLAASDLSNGTAGTGAVVLASSPTISGTTNISAISVANLIAFSGSSSGVTTLKASPVASGSLLLPSASDTLIGKATADTLTNKTFDTSGSGNILKISGNTIVSIAPIGSATVAATTNGAWIPACSVGSITTAYASYERDGNLVYANWDFTMPISATSTQAIVTGLPFPSNDSYTNGMLGFTDASIVSIQGGSSGASISGISFRTSLNGGQATFANMTGKRVIGSIVYKL